MAARASWDALAEHAADGCEAPNPDRSARTPVGLVLADSSIVTLALPKILVQFDVEVAALAWALISFNLALALSALPAAFVARRWPTPVFGVGVVTFAAASLGCALSPSFGALVSLRAVQGVAGAAVVCGALDLLSATMETKARQRAWILAGVIGASFGPAVGGILTQLFGWESIFLVQVPLVLLGLSRLAAPHAYLRRRSSDRTSGPTPPCSSCPARS